MKAWNVAHLLHPQDNYVPQSQFYICDINMLCFLKAQITGFLCNMCNHESFKS
jgi:hypothetical protein